MENRFSRIATLLGEENLSFLKTQTVAICGLGGVGATALESLARSGIMNFILIDLDEVKPSNLNRQILYKKEDINLAKVDVAKKYLLKIDLNFNIITLQKRIEESFLSELKKYQIDFLIDAIDQTFPKFCLLKYCLNNNLPFVSSLGMANRLDPTQVRITTLDLVQGDPLAKKIKSFFKKEQLPLKMINVVYSLEEPLLKGSYLASMMNVPSSAGLALSHFCLQNLLKKKDD